MMSTDQTRQRGKGISNSPHTVFGNSVQQRTINKVLCNIKSYLIFLAIIVGFPNFTPLHKARRLLSATCMQLCIQSARI